MSSGIDEQERLPLRANHQLTADVVNEVYKGRIVRELLINEQLPVSTVTFGTPDDVNDG